MTSPVQPFSSVRRHAKASPAGSTDATEFGPIGLVSLCLLCLMAFLAGMGGATSAYADACPNSGFRTGASAALPDCRAYELVSPANAGAHRPTAGPLFDIPHAFESPLITAGGGSVIFNTVNGALPGLLGSGYEDRYRSVRNSNGWTTELAGMTGAESEKNHLGPSSPDQHYLPFRLDRGSFVSNEGSLVSEFGLFSGGDLLRLPDGSYEMLGKGSLGVDTEVSGKLITANATHVIFEAEVKLEPNAPEAGEIGVYDRTPGPGGVTHTVSLLPGEVPVAGSYLGASTDGTAIAFKGNGKYYVRLDNTSTELVTETADAFAGVSESGAQVFYVQGGNVFSFDTATEATAPVTAVGDAQVVNISADGSHVYFISKTQIGGEGTAGQDNLYVWERGGGTTTFIATVDPSDVADLHPEPEAQGEQNLVNWTSEATWPLKNWNVGAAYDVSRTTPDGSVIVFESKAKLTAYENAGHVEIYRYDAATDELACVSCSGTGPATGDAFLQSFYRVSGDTVRPLTAINPVDNVTEDGEAVFFETTDRLLPGDVSDTRDIYRWKDGELALISSGTSSQNSYLYAATPDGSDVLFLTYDHLLPQDENSVGALYDARIGGGFPPQDAQEEACQDDTCQGPAVSAPVPPFPASSEPRGKGNVKQNRPRACRKARRKVRRGGKTRCVKRKHARHGRAGSNRKASR